MTYRITVSKVEFDGVSEKTVKELDHCDLSMVKKPSEAVIQFAKALESGDLYIDWPVNL